MAKNTSWLVIAVETDLDGPARHFRHEQVVDKVREIMIPPAREFEDAKVRVTGELTSLPQKALDPWLTVLSCECDDAARPHVHVPADWAYAGKVSDQS